MKYIIKFLWISIVHLLVFIVASFIALWEFDATELKEAWSNYKLHYAHMMWHAFKVNHY